MASREISSYRTGHVPTRVPVAGPIAPEWLLGILLFSTAATVLLVFGSGMSVELLRGDVMPYYVSGTIAITLRATLARSPWRVLSAIGRCAEYYAAFTFVALLGAIASYPLAAASHGYRDGALETIDSALRFDWVRWYETVAAHPALQRIGRAAYETIYFSPAIILGWFAWEGKRTEAYRFLVAFWLAAVITLALYPFMPAVGPLSYLWHDAIPYMPESALWQQQLFPLLRDHSLSAIDLGTLRGLVSAPSFHTVAAVLYVAAAWPHRTLRWPILALNLAMLWSTPIEGTHYLSDMLIGAAVAGLTLAIVGRVYGPIASARRSAQDIGPAFATRRA